MSAHPDWYDHPPSTEQEREDIKKFLNSRGIAPSEAVGTGNQIIEGPFSKPYELWRVDSKKERIERLWSADCIEELLKIRRRADWHYEIYHCGKPLVPNE